MLGKVQDELAKLIAREVYKFAKNSGADFYKSLKGTQLAPSGRGLPESVLAMFEEVFLKVLDDHWLQSHGYATWRDGRDEKKFEFLLSRRIVDCIGTPRWSDAAERTAEGVNQIQALGGSDRYNEAVNNAVSALFDIALNKICGEYHEKTNTSGWRVITPVLETNAAPEGSTDFALTRLFYKSHGTKDETLKDLKSARRLITGKWFRKGVSPSAGPYVV